MKEEGEKLPAHGEAQRANAPPRKFISDVDFHDLVVKTNATDTIIGSEESDRLKEE
jgi:hypothetical protein